MGVCGCSVFCCALICVPSGFAFVLVVGGGELVALCVFLVSHGCCVALSHGAVGLSEVCDCDIS